MKSNQNNQNKTSTSYFDKLSSRLLTNETKPTPVNDKKIIKNQKINSLFGDIEKKYSDYLKTETKPLSSHKSKKPITNSINHNRINTEFSTSRLGFDYSSKKSTIVQETKQINSQNNSIAEKLKSYQFDHKRSISNLDTKFIISKDLYKSPEQTLRVSANKSNQKLTHNTGSKSIVSFLKDKIEKKGLKIKSPQQHIQPIKDSNYLFTDTNSFGQINGLKQEYDKFKMNKKEEKAPSMTNSINVSTVNTKKTSSINFISKLDEIKNKTNSNFYKASKAIDTDVTNLSKPEKEIQPNKNLITINNYSTSLKKGQLTNNKIAISSIKSNSNKKTYATTSKSYLNVSNKSFRDKEKEKEKITNNSTSRKISNKNIEEPSKKDASTSINQLNNPNLVISLNEEKISSLSPVVQSKFAKTPNININLNEGSEQKTKIEPKVQSLIKPVLNLKKTNIFNISAMNLSNNFNKNEEKTAGLNQIDEKEDNDKTKEFKNVHEDIKKESDQALSQVQQILPIVKNISKASFKKGHITSNSINMITLTTKEKTNTNEIIGFNEDDILLLENSILNDKSVIDQSGDYFLKESRKISDYIKQCKLLFRLFINYNII